MPDAADPLLSRRYMRDVVVDLATIGPRVRDAGSTGDIEVEIFNQKVWDTNGNIVLAAVKEPYPGLVHP